MFVLSLDDIVDGLAELEVKRFYKVGLSGLYEPSQSTIFYNPYEIASGREFMITIFHELAHHYDSDRLSELTIEEIALETVEDPDLRAYLHMYFYDEIGRYWSHDE